MHTLSKIIIIFDQQIFKHLLLIQLKNLFCVKIVRIYFSTQFEQILQLSKTIFDLFRKKFDNNEKIVHIVNRYSTMIFCDKKFMHFTYKTFKQNH